MEKPDVEKHQRYGEQAKGDEQVALNSHRWAATSFALALACAAYVFPCFACSDEAGRNRGDSEFVGDGLVRSAIVGAFTDSQDLCFSEFGPTVALPGPGTAKHRDGVLDVLRFCDHFKVHQAVVTGVPVLVVDLQPVWDWAEKRRAHQTVDPAKDFPAIALEGALHVPVPVWALGDFFSLPDIVSCNVNADASVVGDGVVREPCHRAPLLSGHLLNHGPLCDRPASIRPGAPVHDFVSGGAMDASRPADGFYCLPGGELLADCDYVLCCEFAVHAPQISMARNRWQIWL